MSIFTKDCPVCAATHAVHVVRCGCGYCFDPHKLDGVTQELEVIAQEERLYHDYLSARADQADKAWRAAKVATAMDPENTVKGAEALLAKQTALSTRAEMDAQDARAQAVSARIKVVRTNRRNRRQAKSSSAAAPRPMPPTLRDVVAPPRPKPIPPSVTPAVTSAPPKQHLPVTSAAAAPQKPAATTSAVKPVTHPPKASKPQSIVPNPVVTMHPAAAVTPISKPATVPVARPPTPTPAVSRTAITTPIAASASPPPAVRPAAPAPTITRDPTPAFRATQATKAAQVAAPVGPPKQDCQNCGAKVAATAKRCRCGFEMPLSASQMPSLAMSTEDRAALLSALAPTGKNKP